MLAFVKGMVHGRRDVLMQHIVNWELISDPRNWVFMFSTLYLTELIAHMVYSASQSVRRFAYLSANVPFCSLNNLHQALPSAGRALGSPRRLRPRRHLRQGPERHTPTARSDLDFRHEAVVGQPVVADQHRVHPSPLTLPAGRPVRPVYQSDQIRTREGYRGQCGGINTYILRPPSRVLKVNAGLIHGSRMSSFRGDATVSSASGKRQAFHYVIDLG